MNVLGKKCNGKKFCFSGREFGSVLKFHNPLWPGSKPGPKPVPDTQPGLFNNDSIDNNNNKMQSKMNYEAEIKIN